MNLKLRIACAALLAASATPAWALQLGQIQVKSALNQPLVAAIPLRPKNLTELEGLTVGLAPAEDFTRAGLQVTPTDQTLQFHVVTDNNGQKLILVTSPQPVTDPYLDFLLQVNTREGKQVREFVVLLNPVIAAPAPGVQAAPVASAPGSAVRSSQPAELPPSSAFVPPQAQAAPQPSAPSQPPAASAPAALPAPAPPRAVPQPTPSAQPGNLPEESVNVHRGDTLYGIAKDATRGSDVTVNQLMVAIKAANPEAFFKNNINDLKAGAILRIPTRDVIDQTTVAEANAEVHRQYESWRASRPHPATVVEGTAAQAAANAAPKPGNAAPASDHLSLVPPTGEGRGASSRSGVAGGTGSETVTGLQQKLQNDRSALISLDQSNADLESRVRSLKDISDKSDKLLSLKDATVAELQRKLADVQSGKAGATGASSVATTASASAAQPAAKAPAAAASVARPGASAKSATAKPRPSAPQWYERPLTWAVAGLIVLALVLIGLVLKRRGGDAPVVAHGPLTDPDDVTPPPVAADDKAALQAHVAEHPEDLPAHLALCRWYHEQGDETGFVAAATAMREHVADLHGAEWREASTMGEELAPHLPLFELPSETHDDPYGMAALHQPLEAQETLEATPPADEPDTSVEHEAAHTPGLALVAEDHVPEPTRTFAADTEPEFADDPVDTKLDLARAYLDMGDPVGARAMLEEVVEEGSQAQKDEARRLLADVAG
ncbi:MAG TPA: FimV/HubP family polar landmark protein [Rhodanobacteraceae bacterium]|nr:FimV/HubP family polar landmark protein [Rhodanobacteraceae bacterium]